MTDRDPGANDAPLSHAPERRASRATERTLGATRSAAGVSGRMTARVVALLAREGHDVNVDCVRTGLAYDDLVDPSARISYPAVDALIELAVALRGEDTLAVAIAETTDDETYGAAGLALATAPSFAEGLARAFAYQRLWGDGERFVLRSTSDRLIAGFSHPGASPIAKRVLESLAMIELVSSARVLVAEHVRPRAVRFAFVPSCHAALEEKLGVLPSYGAIATEVEFDAEIADAPIRVPRAALDLVVAREAQRALSALPSIVSVVGRVRNTVSDAGLGASLVAAAARLRMSARTLQRRLRDEGTSYGALIDDLRRDRAARLTARGASEKEIAIALGYRDPSALARARARWKRG